MTIKIPVGLLAGVVAAVLAVALVFGGVGIGVVSGWGDEEPDRHVEICYELQVEFLDTPDGSAAEDKVIDDMIDEGCWK